MPISCTRCNLNMTACECSRGVLAIGCSFDRPELVRLEEDNAALRLEIKRLCEAYDRLIKTLRERLLRSEVKIHNARQALEGDIADPPRNGFL